MQNSGVNILGNLFMIPNPEPLIFQVSGVGSDVTSGKYETLIETVILDRSKLIREGLKKNKKKLMD